MAQNCGTILTKFANNAEKLVIDDKENKVKVLKAQPDLDANFSSLKQHQNAKLAEMKEMQEKILVKASNRTAAEQRGKRAEHVLRLKQVTEAAESQKILNARMKALHAEKERAGFVASLPPPSKDLVSEMLKKYDQDDPPQFGKRRFFKSIRHYELEDDNLDARNEAILVQEKDIEVKKMQCKRAEDTDLKTVSRFNKAIKKEKHMNVQHEIMSELERVYRADRVKQQQKLQMTYAPKLTPFKPIKVEPNESESEKAVKMILDENCETNDSGNSFITLRRKRTNVSRNLEESNLFGCNSPIALEHNILGWNPRKLNVTDLTSSCDDSIQNGQNVALNYPLKHKEFKLQSKPATTVASTQTGASNVISTEKSSYRSSPISFKLLPQDINSVNPISNSIAEKYKQQLLCKAKLENFLNSPKDSIVSSLPSTPGTQGNKDKSSTTVGSSTPISILSPIPSAAQGEKVNQNVSTSSESSSKLSEMMRKVLEKHIVYKSEEKVESKELGINPEWLNISKFKPKFPTRFFSDIHTTESNTDHVSKKKVALLNQPVRHRIFPELPVVPRPDDKRLCTSSKKPTLNDDKQIPLESEKPIISKSPGLSPNTTKFSDSSTSSQGSVGSSKNSSDSKTKTLPQQANSDMKIPTYIQHKYLTYQMGLGKFNQTIDTIDDLREILSCLPCGGKLEDCIRSKPPVSFPYWVDENAQPHELSTIQETDTPQTSMNFSTDRVLLPPDGGFFTHLSLDGCRKQIAMEYSLSKSNSSLAVVSEVSEISSSKNSPKWDDILKANCRKNSKVSPASSTSTNFSPNVEVFEPKSVNSQSTPVKAKKIIYDEYDLMSENLTLIGPEITVTNEPVPLDNTFMSQSLLSFVRHEEDCNLNP